MIIELFRIVMDNERNEVHVYQNGEYVGQCLPDNGFGWECRNESVFDPYQHFQFSHPNMAKDIRARTSFVNFKIRGKLMPSSREPEHLREQPLYGRSFLERAIDAERAAIKRAIAFTAGGIDGDDSEMNRSVMRWVEENRLKRNRKIAYRDALGREYGIDEKGRLKRFER